MFHPSAVAFPRDPPKAANEGHLISVTTEGFTLDHMGHYPHGLQGRHWQDLDVPPSRFVQKLLGDIVGSTGLTIPDNNSHHPQV